MLQQRFIWQCAFCHETQEGITPQWAICKPCGNAWRDVVLEKRKQNEKENKKISNLLKDQIK